MTAADFIQHLLDQPPATDAAFERQLAEHPAAELRAALVDLLARPDLEAGERSLFWSAMNKLGPGAESARLQSIVLDRKNPRIVRSLALVALGPPSTPEVEAFYRKLPQEEHLLGLEATLEEIVDALQSNPDAGREITSQLVQAKGPGQLPLATAFVERTLEAGVPLELFFGDALQRPDLHTIRPMLLRAFVEHGGVGAIDALEQTRMKLPGEQAKREVAGALLKLRTRLQVSPEKNEGEAYVGTCDGEGAYAILAVTGSGKRRRLANVVLRATGEIRDGFYDGDVTTEFVEQMIDRVETETSTRHAKVSMAQASYLVTHAMNMTTANDGRVPADARIAVQAITKTLPAKPEPVPTAERVDEAFLREALEHDLVFESWFFDDGDLGGLEPPKSGKVTKAWHAKATKQLEPVAKARVYGMARHHAWWSQAVDDLESASQFAAAAQEVEADFRGSTLVRLMLEKTLALPDSADDDMLAGPAIGHDEGLRRRLKTLYFADVKRPTGRDLARLDFTEVAYAALSHAYTTFPSERRPPDEVLLETAAALGPALATMIIDQQMGDANLKALFDASPGLTDAEKQTLMSLPFQLALGFAEDVCEQCPVRCIDKPKGSFAKAFDDARHPAHAVLGPSIEI